MNTIPVMGIPILNRGDLLLRLVQSIDYPVDLLYIVDNSNGLYGVSSYFTQITELISTGQVPIKELKVISDPSAPNGNLGVAASWNRIVTDNPNTPYWFLIGNDILFTPGDLEKMNQGVQEHPECATVFANHGHSFFVVTKLGIETVGLFDENFYPAYCEDVDYSRRMKVLNVPALDVQGINSKHGEAPSWGSMTIYSDDDRRELNGVSHEMNWRYYEFKWGSRVWGNETFVHPYNDETLTARDWILMKEFRSVSEQAYKQLYT